MAKGDKQAMANYNIQQVKQLTRLIEVTRTDLPKVSSCLSPGPGNHSANGCVHAFRSALRLYCKQPSRHQGCLQAVVSGLQL
jgi:hypothetical protein